MFSVFFVSILARSVSGKIRPASLRSSIARPGGCRFLPPPRFLYSCTVLTVRLSCVAKVRGSTTLPPRIILCVLLFEALRAFAVGREKNAFSVFLPRPSSRRTVFCLISHSWSSLDIRVTLFTQATFLASDFRLFYPAAFSFHPFTHTGLFGLLFS